MKTMGAGAFKAHCLAVLDEVARQHGRVVITKRGKPVATLASYEGQESKAANPLKGSILFEGDLVSSLVETIW
ncbi:MAG: type II toxin-antitoxin system Phd/YefM family antitoxin [Verrucomicrobiota bacterium]|nr:type II toxin-antitoxin system Phd/YefM family antitoxin [Verrucomicrobiota bacterium]